MHANNVCVWVVFGGCRFRCRRRLGLSWFGLCLVLCRPVQQVCLSVTLNEYVCVLFSFLVCVFVCVKATLLSYHWLKLWLALLHISRRRRC